jgi:HAD superfamily hydrolase (TIGR01549 family)
MKIKHIFFDFDGVLAESVNIKTDAFKQMYLYKGEGFAKKVEKYHLENGGVSRYEKFKVFNGEWLKEEINQQKIDELAQKFSDLVIDGVVNAPEVFGAFDFLNSSEMYKKYIITGTPTVEIKPILKRRKMDHFFEGVFGSPEKKGFWVKHILKNEKVSANECVFIGDALADYNAAIHNNVPFILRETTDAEELFRDYTGYRLKDLSSLHEILEQINSDLCNV